MAQRNAIGGATGSNQLDKRPLTGFTTLKPDPSLASFTGVLSDKERQYPFKSQFGEDRVILSSFFRNFRNGFFVELGAMDGVTFSNSYVFQNTLGWKGVLIEPSNVFDRLRVNPRCLNGGAFCLNMAICNSWRLGDFVTGGHDAVGGLQETMINYHEKYWFGGPKQVVQVPCGPMGDVLKLLGTKRIDFFSIDVEGAELYIVETMDWEKIPVHVVMVERNLQSEEPERIDRILLQFGFKFFGYFGKPIGKAVANNVVWVNPKNARSADLNDSFLLK